MFIHIGSSCQQRGGCPLSHTLDSVPSQSLSRHNGTKSSDSKQEAAPKNAGRQRRLTRKYPPLSPVDQTETTTTTTTITTRTDASRLHQNRSKKKKRKATAPVSACWVSSWFTEKLDVLKSAGIRWKHWRHPVAPPAPPAASALIARDELHVIRVALFRHRDLKWTSEASARPKNRSPSCLRQASILGLWPDTFFYKKKIKIKKKVTFMSLIKELFCHFLIKFTLFHQNN